MVEYVEGDLLEKDYLDHIVQQVNCKGAMNSGIAKAIRKKYPIVYDKYRALCETTDTPGTLLGRKLSVRTIKDDGSDITIHNIFAQTNYGYDGKRYTDYEAFASALEKVKNEITRTDMTITTIGFPHRIGCDRGGGDWKIIQSIIVSTFENCKNVVVYIVKL